MPPNRHAVLSASSSHRWLHCNPSARLELEFEDRETEAAAEGTAAHALAEHKLRKALKMRSTRPVSKYDSDEMEMYTDGYLEFVLEAIEEARQDCPDPKVLIEQRLDFSCYVPDGFGTGDCLIVADKLLHIIDLKYGQGVLVNAEENPQMMLYALGALRIFDCLYDIETVSMTIYQPRRENVSTWVISVAELRDWAEKTLKPKAELAFKGEGEYCPGSWCQFCKAAVKCRARADAKLQLAKYEFAQPPLLSDAEIGDILGKLDDLTKWANELVAYAQEAAVNHGKQWPGYKLWRAAPIASTPMRMPLSLLPVRPGIPTSSRSPSFPSPRWRSSWAKRPFPRCSAVWSSSPKESRRSFPHPTGVRLLRPRVQNKTLPTIKENCNYG